MLVTRESFIQGIRDAAGKEVRNFISSKASPSYTSQYLSFSHPKLLLLWKPCRILYSLNSFEFVANAEAAAKEKQQSSIPAAKTDWVMGVHFIIKSVKHFLLLGWEMKREHLLKGNYTDGSLSTGNETFSCCYYVAKNREM